MNARRVTRRGSLREPTERLPSPALAPGAVELADALFEAMRRREAYGTSGPRILVRFSGGREMETERCDAPDFVARG